MKIDFAEAPVENRAIVRAALPVAYRLAGLAFVAVGSAACWSAILSLSAMVVGVDLGLVTLLGVSGAIGTWCGVIAAAVMLDKA